MRRAAAVRDSVIDVVCLHRAGLRPAALIARFGAANVKSAPVVAFDDGPQSGTVLFADPADARVEILWIDPTATQASLSRCRLRIMEAFISIQRRIEAAAVRAKRDPQSITLVAVTKTVSVDRIRDAAASGVKNVGENRLQDAISKMDQLRDLGLTWHFIGHIQTNKVKKVAEQFDWIHSVDRTDVADKLGLAAAKPLSILIEVKLHEEPNKSGAAVGDLPSVIDAIRRHDKLLLKGLMAVPPFLENPEDVRPYFRKLRELAARYELSELSMGMTHDFEVAIEEGATMVRIGTGLFGKRL